jgi:hypothetical protein
LNRYADKVFTTSRTRLILSLSIGLLVAGGSMAGCRKSGVDKAQADAVKQSLDGLKKQFAELQTKFMALRKQVDAIPPDLPGFQEFRAKFYAAEEGRGVTDGKTMWLSSRLDEAVSVGNRAELEQISKDITQTYDDIRRIDELHVKMMHQAMAFERMARQEGAAAAAPPSPTPPIAKAKRSKSKP